MLREDILDSLGAYADYSRIHSPSPKVLEYKDKLVDQLLQVIQKDLKEKIEKLRLGVGYDLGEDYQYALSNVEDILEELGKEAG